MLIIPKSCVGGRWGVQTFFGFRLKRFESQWIIGRRKPSRTQRDKGALDGLSNTVLLSLVCSLENIWSVNMILRKNTPALCSHQWPSLWLCVCSTLEMSTWVTGCIYLPFFLSFAHWAEVLSLCSRCEWLVAVGCREWARFLHTASVADWEGSSGEQTSVPRGP